MENELVRYSRAGDEFHYRWAARRCLKMVHPQSPITCIVIEGSKERKKAGEYVIDVAEYEEITEDSKEKISYFQLKHTTQRLDKPFTLSELKDTVEGFANRFRALFDDKGEVYKLKDVTFAITTNRPVSQGFKNNLQTIRAGKKASKQFQTTIQKYTGLTGKRLCDFCTCLEIIDEEGDYITQGHVLHAETSEFLASNVDNKQLESIIALVRGKALPGNTGEIHREDILKRFDITSTRDLFPAPAEFEDCEYLVKREQHEQIQAEIIEATTPIIIHASGGVGKSVVARQLATSLPTGSLGIVYDCFGAGQYRNRSQPRHRSRDALVQIINEIALYGLCQIFVPRDTDLDDAILRAFMLRLNIAAKVLRRSNEKAVLFVFFDAADNAEMAANEFSEHCFANHLLREEVPEGCRIVFLCRTEPERIGLLKPSSQIKKIELKPFSIKETTWHLHKYFPHATELHGIEFHSLTGGNPRVQANTLAKNHTLLADAIAELGPSGSTVEEQISRQLESSILKIKDALPENFQTSVDAICFGLANLTPFIPLEVLATTANVDISTIRSFVTDLERPLWISENSVQFRDEPTETWFRSRFAATVEQVEFYISRLKPLASDSSYVSQTLPILLLQAKKYDELIELALSDDCLPEDNPTDKRNIRVYRLQFAFKAALKKKQYADAAKLSLRAGEEVSGNKRQIEILKKNADLTPLLQSSQRIQELAFGRTLRGEWAGSENVYSASLLASTEEFKGEAISFLREATNWLFLYFNEQEEEEESKYREDKLQDDDILEMAYSHFHLHGIEKLVEFLLSWKPPEVGFRISRLIAKRLIDVGDFEAIDKFSLACNGNRYLLVAISNELLEVGRFLRPDIMRQALALLVNEKQPLSIEQNYWGEKEQSLRSAILSFLEASAVVGLPSDDILAVLGNYFPVRASTAVDSNFQYIERRIFLRRTALSIILSRKIDFNIEDLVPEKYIKDNKEHHLEQQERQFKQIIKGLLPWYIIRCRALMGEVDSLGAALLSASQDSEKSSEQNYGRSGYSSFEAALPHFESIMLLKIPNVSEEEELFKQFFRSKHELRLPDHLKAVRAVYRIERLAKMADQLEQSCYETIENISDESPEAKAAYYIGLSRAVLPVSKEDARAYFDHAIEEVSRFGDEVVDRWNAVVALAKRSTEGKTSSAKTAYRFIRCAELVGSSVAREKHWNRSEAIRVCAVLHPPSAFAALSRWRDRKVGRFEYQIYALADESVRSALLLPSVGWSLSAFFWEYGFDNFVSLCIGKEPNTNRQQDLLNKAIDELSLNNATTAEWKKVEEMAQKLSLNSHSLTEGISRSERQEQIRKQGEENTQRNHSPEDVQEEPDWENLFNGLDLTERKDIEIALERFKDLQMRTQHEHFWREVFNIVLARDASRFLNSLVHIENASLYDIEEALSNFPESYKQKVSVKAAWPKALLEVSRRFCTKLINRYIRSRFFEEVYLQESEILLIYKGITEGLSESSVLIEEDMLFAFSEIVESSISSEEATQLLDYALSRFEHHIDHNFADGDWDDWLHPPEDNLEALTGFVWAALGSPHSAMRWQAVHSVRKLAEMGCDRAIEALLNWMEKDCVEAFGSHDFPFYNLHARLYLMIALARIAVDQPEIVRKHHVVFEEHALNRMPHVLIRAFASRIALSIETAFPNTYKTEVTNNLQKVGVSQLPKENLNLANDGFKDTPFSGKDHSLQEANFHFGYDFDKYWLDFLGNEFGLSSPQIQELARDVILNEWNIKTEDGHALDPRDTIWRTHHFHERETYHSHGEHPRADKYRFYLSYHALFCVAQNLLETMPIIQHYQWDEDSWSQWLQRHSLTRGDGRWLADRRDPIPLEPVDWGMESDEKDWETSVSSDDFLSKLLSKHNGETWISVGGSWDSRDRTKNEGCQIYSSLVSQQASQSLLNALNTCSHPYDFKLPDYKEERMELTEPPFELKGWLWREQLDRGLDEFDPRANDINYPPYRVDDSIAKLIGLSSDTEKRRWYVGSAEQESLICEIWNSPTREYPRNEPQDGIRVRGSLRFLASMISLLKCELIIEVQIRRRLNESSHGEIKNDRKEYELPKSRVYILSAGGKLRDTKTCYQLRDVAS